MKRITFEVDDSFAKEFSHYCTDNNKSKKSVIVDLLSKEINQDKMMEQYNKLNEKIFSFEFINKENYKRLSKFDIEDEEPWKMKYNLQVNKYINNYFDEDGTLKSLINYWNEFGIKELNIPHVFLDHYYFMKFNKKSIDYDFEDLYGIMTFPYLNFEDLNNIISSWNTSFWNLYIINPALMKYQDGSGLGLFITPLPYEPIMEHNGIFETLTGYKLFYLWSNKEFINPISQNKEPLDISIWLNKLTDNEFPNMYKKIVKFWCDNKDKIKCNGLETSYFEFTHKMPFYIPSLMGLTLEGEDFEMIDTKTGWTTGKCNRIEFDLETFKCIYVDRKEVIFSEKMIKNFKEGTFELKMI